jgi:hypothetical protein
VPFYTEINSSSCQFPQTCPYCENHEADTYLVRSFKQLVSHYLLFKKTRIIKIKIPCCHNCKNKFNLYLVVPLSVLFVGLISIVILAIYEKQMDHGFLESFLMGVFFCSLAAFPFLLYREHKLCKIYIPYVGKESIIITHPSEKYISSISLLNDSECKKGIFIYKRK